MNSITFAKEDIMEKRQDKIICNKCGREIKVEQGIEKQDYIAVEKSWGYFSNKDGKSYKFIMCEECVDSMVEDFAVPVESADITEFL